MADNDVEKVEVENLDSQLVTTIILLMIIQYLYLLKDFVTKIRNQQSKNRN